MDVRNMMLVMIIDFQKMSCGDGRLRSGLKEIL